NGRKTQRFRFQDIAPSGRPHFESAAVGRQGERNLFLGSGKRHFACHLVRGEAVEFRKIGVERRKRRGSKERCEALGVIPLCRLDCFKANQTGRGHGLGSPSIGSISTTPAQSPQVASSS